MLDAQLVHRVEQVDHISADGTLPDALATQLFVDGLNSFFVFDAARAPGLVEWLEAHSHAPLCLFEGQAAQNLNTVAPWLVEVAPDSRLLGALFTEGEPGMFDLWGVSAGIFVQSASDAAEVVRHLRRLTKVRDENDAWVYFRFWDPKVAYDYFAAARDWPDRVESFFASHVLSDLRMLAVQEDVGAARIFAQTRANGVPAKGGNFQIGAQERAFFTQQRRPDLKQELADWLLRLDAKRFRPFGPARRLAIAEHALRQGDAFGFAFKEEYAHLIYMMSFLGGWFHTSSDFAPFYEPWAQTSDRRYETMRLSFVDAHKAAYADPNARHAVLTRLYELASFIPGGIEKAGPADIKTLSGLAEQLLPAGVSPNLARSETIETCKSLNLDDARVKCLFYVLRLVLGPRPLDDPFQPWLREKLFASGQRPTNVARTAEFALRRLRHLI